MVYDLFGNGRTALKVAINSVIAARRACGEGIRHHSESPPAGHFNIYNLFNGSASSTLNTNDGPLWLQPTLLQDGRMVQFSASLAF